MTNPLERLSTYTIRRRVLKILGASFEAFDSSGTAVAFSSQKAFKLREDIRVYSDESKQQELITIRARQIIDFAAAYDIVDATEGKKVGAARRQGLKSLMRDSWEVLDVNDQPIGRIEEDSTWLALVRRFVANIVPQTFRLRDAAGKEQAELRVHFNPFVYRMTVSIHDACTIDRRLVFGAAVLLAAIEGRQQ